MTNIEIGDSVECVNDGIYMVTTTGVECIVASVSYDRIAIFLKSRYPREQWDDIIEHPEMIEDLFWVDADDFKIVNKNILKTGNILKNIKRIIKGE